MPVCRLGLFGVLAWLASPGAPLRGEGPAEAANPAAQPAELPAGHSAHGEVFNEGPRQQAYLMGNTGKVSFPITTKVPEAQQFFNQGVGQLHGFWYFEAERSFRRVAALDPDCAMAYWGMAMANRENDKRAKGFVDKALERKAGASRREALWIDGLAAYVAAGPANDQERRRQYVRSLEAIIHDFADDLEAKAFLAVQIWQNSQHGMPISSHQAVEALIGQVLAVEPLHPVHHYRIHLWDGEKPARALASAALCGQSAPGIAHMWHMPGHTFSNLERYADAAWQQEASARVDHAHMIRDHVLPDQIHNYAHNNEWLIRNLINVGRVRDAVDLAKNMIELPRHPQYNHLNRASSSQHGRARLFDVLTVYELWDELIALGQTGYLEPTDIPHEQVRRLRALGTAYLCTGDVANGHTQIAALAEMLKQEQAQQQAAGDAAEVKAREAKQPDDQIAKAKADAIQAHNGRLQPIEAALSELRGHWAQASGDHTAALAHFEKAAGISKEFLARAHFEAGDKAKAEQLAREAVEQGKNKVHSLATYVEVLHRSGTASEAAAAFEQLRRLAGQLDAQAPIFQRLQPIARELGLPDDWRLAQPAPPDVGQRPELESLGPFRWHPSPAPDWSLADPAGNRVALADYRGKPLVVILYLGFGCVHCVEQLNAFAPLRPEYADAGIVLVAISTDTSEALRTALARRAPAAGPALDFPMLSDVDLAVFKAYRAYDDFENMPLHGTFLIDGGGLVRWQDMSYEPFTDARFLLNEAKRLLSQPLTR